MNQLKKNVRYQQYQQRFVILGGMWFVIGLIASFYGSDQLIVIGYICIVFGFVFITIAGVLNFLKSKSIQNQEFCSGCGNEVKSDDNFCPKCGEKFVEKK